MSIKQFVWNLAGMESMIPEDELPEADVTVMQGEGVNDTALLNQSSSDPAPIPSSQDSGRQSAEGSEEVEKSVGAFLISLVGRDEEEPVTPVLHSAPPTPKQDKSFLGSLFSGEKSSDPVKAEEPTPRQDKSFLGSLFSSEKSPDPVEDQPGEQASFLGNLFGTSEPAEKVDENEQPEGFIESLFRSRPASPVTSNAPTKEDEQKDSFGEHEETFIESLFKPTEEEVAVLPNPEPLFIDPLTISAEIPAEVAIFAHSAEQAQTTEDINTRQSRIETVVPPTTLETNTRPTRQEPKNPQTTEEGKPPSTNTVQPTSPLSFFGSWFGSPANSPPPLQKVLAESDVEKEPDSDTEKGFGSFLVSLVTNEGESQEPRESRLGQLANELASPQSSTVLGPPLSHRSTGFDEVDAEDAVKRIEQGKYEPKSKQMTRLLVSDETEGQMRLQEAEAALKILREIREENSGTKSSGWNIFKLPEPLVSKPAVVPKTEDAGKVSEGALRKANEVLKHSRTSTSKMIHRKDKVEKRVNPRQHTFEPLSSSFSERIKSFPRSDDNILAASERTLSFSSAIESAGTSGRPSLVVASVEVKTPFYR